MSKKTATKKKPTQLHRASETRKKPTIADDLHVLKESFEAQAEFLIDWRKRSEDRIAAMETNVERWLKNNHEDIVAQIEVNRAKLIALESRSAPAEEWKPKVGDLVTFPGTKYPPLVAGLVTHVDVRYSGEVLLTVDWSPIPSKIMHWASELNPSTPAEIASHKAKEEQRAIAKRAEDERAKELAKVPEFGTRVKFCKADRKGPYETPAKVGCDVPDRDGEYLLCGQDDKGATYPYWRKRDQFQIID